MLTWGAPSAWECGAVRWTGSEGARRPWGRPALYRQIQLKYLSWCHGCISRGAGISVVADSSPGRGQRCQRSCHQLNALNRSFDVARARAQLEEVEEVEELDQVEDDFAEDGLGDEAAGDGFDLERGRRSLASIFDSDEDSVLEVDSAQQDESLLVRAGLLPCAYVA